MGHPFSVMYSKGVILLVNILLTIVKNNLVC